MAFQAPITVKEAIKHISHNEYLLPDIQRDFVWSTGQIENLFDSLMQGYPINSFLFWRVDRKKEERKEERKDYHFYSFRRSFNALKDAIPQGLSVNGENELTVVLDGQQRLTSLYIGLKGTYAYKLPNKRGGRGNEHNYPERKLYLNLLGPADEEDNKAFDFRFLTEKDVDNPKKDDKHWFPVGKILDIEDLSGIMDHLHKHELASNKNASDILCNLYKVIHDTPVISYYKEGKQDLDHVLNIFIRTNSGGTKLQYSDLLFSTVIAGDWEGTNAKDEVNKFVSEETQKNIGFDRDFVLRACLVLSGAKKIGFKANNFHRKNTEKIGEHWEDIKTAIRLAIRLLYDLRYTNERLTSKFPIIPIAYYMLKIGLPSEGHLKTDKFKHDREEIRKWVALSLIKGFFNRTSVRKLEITRDIIRESTNGFPLEQIKDSYRKNLTFSEDDLDDLLRADYGNKRIFSLLLLLYPVLDHSNEYHIDHIFPRASFNDQKFQEAGT